MRLEKRKPSKTRTQVTISSDGETKIASLWKNVLFLVFQSGICLSLGRWVLGSLSEVWQIGCLHSKCNKWWWPFDDVIQITPPPPGQKKSICVPGPAGVWSEVERNPSRLPTKTKTLQKVFPSVLFFSEEPLRGLGAKSKKDNRSLILFQQLQTTVHLNARKRG